MRDRLRSLYICYLSLDDPLTHSQVLAYLEGVAQASHEIHLLSFETRRMPRAARQRLRLELAARGIRWRALRYHKRPSLPATAFDTLAGALYAALLVLRFRIDTLHARNHVPMAMALLARRLTGRRARALIFDIRGLMAEEYVDVGSWRAGGVPFRLVKAVERAGIARATGIVVLTERVRRLLFGDEPDERVLVIPCCADIKRVQASAAEPISRASLGLADGPIMVYVGKLGGWYMAAEMAQFFAAARAIIPGLQFLILTQGDQGLIREPLLELGAFDDAAIVSVPPARLGAHLAIASFGISFIRRSPSKVSSSPTKVGEYLAAGLPVVSTAGIGDLDALLTPDVGVLVRDHSRDSYERAAKQLARLLTDADLGPRCAQLAAAELGLETVGVPRYRVLYERVAATITSRADGGTARG